MSPGLRTVTFSDGLTVDLYHRVEAGLIAEDQVIQDGPDDGTLMAGRVMIRSSLVQVRLLSSAEVETTR